MVAEARNNDHLSCAQLVPNLDKKHPSGQASSTSKLLSTFGILPGTVWSIIGGCAPSPLAPNIIRRSQQHSDQHSTCTKNCGRR